MNPAQRFLVLCLHAYKGFVSPCLTALFGPAGLGCRFTPTCSQYAIQAVQTHGAWRGAWLALCRLCRCHPWGGCGDDPVLPNTRPTRRAPSASHTINPLNSCNHGS